MPKRSSFLLAIAAVAVFAAPAFAQSVKEQVAGVEERFNEIHAEAEKLTSDIDREVRDRDMLVLQRRFVAGRDFHFLVKDYRGAAEIFHAIVHHPVAKSIPAYDEALYYLAESLYQLNTRGAAEPYFRQIRAIGPATEYYGIALVRLIQISIHRDDLGAAEGYYRELLQQLPDRYDGSLGMYIYGRELYARDAAKATAILEGVPEGADYFPMAQYFLAAMDTRAREYHRAVGRLRRLKSNLEPENPEAAFVAAQANLALGRIEYERDDFPRALASYVEVTPGDEGFDDAMYESLWVLLTRNDYMLLKIKDERNAFNRMSNNFTDFTAAFDAVEKGVDIGPIVKDVDGMQGTMEQMREMIEKIDEHLANLQKDATTNYNRLVDAAPNSPVLPDAELLMGNIYTQAEDFEEAKETFRRVQGKYSHLANAVYERAGQLGDDAALLGTVGKGLANEDEYRARTIPNQAPAGMPPEISYWLAADAEVRRTFDVYEDALAKRRDIEEMRRIISDVENEMNRMERGSVFPILKETRRRSLELIDQANALKAEIAALMANPDIKPDHAQKISSYPATLTQDVSKLQAMQSQLEQRKNQTLASYRELYRKLAQPVPEFTQPVEQAYSAAADVAARTARAELEAIQLRLDNYIKKARAGVVDAEYREAEAASQQIRDVQKEMNEELRRFRLQYQKQETESSDSGSGED
ncbi:hypothetical protein K8I61_16465 [bacterium]|nr:hypothetical protein [bacterium]